MDQCSCSCSKCLFLQSDGHTLSGGDLSLSTHSHTDASIDSGYQCERLARSSEVKLNKLPSSVSLSAYLSLFIFLSQFFSFCSLFLSLVPSCLFLVVLAASLSCYLFSCSLSPLLLTADEPVLPYCLLPTAASSPRPLQSCSLPSGPPHHL